MSVKNANSKDSPGRSTISVLSFLGGPHEVGKKGMATAANPDRSKNFLLPSASFFSFAIISFFYVNFIDGPNPRNLGSPSIPIGILVLLYKNRSIRYGQ